MKLKQMIQSPARKLTKLAQKLQQCLNERKPKLIETPLMLCALFLDPRYKFAIDTDPDKIQLAKLTLERIWERLKTVNGSAPTEETMIHSNATAEDSMTSFYAELDLHVNESLGLQTASTSSSIDGSCDKNSIKNAIAMYERSVSGFRMRSAESIHTFWETKREEFGDELYQIASIIFAIPPTQASVERDFSALKYMLTDRRYNLNQELLESLLLIHLNRDFFIQVRTTEIENA